MGKKKCSGCSRMLTVDCFHKDKHTSDGLCCKCKECRSTAAGKILTCGHCGKMFNKYGRGRNPLFCPACKESGTTPCKQCGEPVKAKDRHRFCGLSCVAKYNSKGKKPNIYTLTCQECGITFERFSNGKKQKFCSKKCMGASQRTLKGTTRECIICGDAFEPTHKETKCCSSKCQATASNKRLVESLAKTTRVCQECGKEYIPLVSNQIYCSKNCRDRVYARNNPDYAAAKRHRRRSRLASVEHEEIAASEIYERDGWRCGICGKRVNKKLKYPDPLSSTLDHIIPLSLGGPHTKSNLQLAHYICNITKGNRNIMPNDKGQLMLV